MASLRSLFPSWSSVMVDFLAQCLRTNADVRPKCCTLLQHPLFTQDGFADKFLEELRQNVAKESAMNPLSNNKLDAASRVYRNSSSSIGRWQMTLIKEKRSTTNNSTGPEIAESEEPPAERPSPPQINRPRDLRYCAPISVIPNTTYIRRLEHKGLLMPDTKGCVLPALTPKANAKRKKLDLPAVKNR